MKGPMQELAFLSIFTKGRACGHLKEDCTRRSLHCLTLKGYVRNHREIALALHIPLSRGKETGFEGSALANSMCVCSCTLYMYLYRFKFSPKIFTDSVSNFKGFQSIKD